MNGRQDVFRYFKEKFSGIKEEIFVFGNFSMTPLSKPNLEEDRRACMAFESLS
jgi:hypothetical protein